MAGKRVEVHLTLTNDLGKILATNQRINLAGECDFLTALNISILTLKHRQNKNQKQRIIMFVGSPIKHSIEDVEQVGKKLKKYNVAVDVISFGNIDENREIIQKFIDSVNNSNNSSITEVPIGEYIVDTLFSSPIMSELGNEGFNDIPIDSGNQVPNQGGVGMSQFERDINLAIQNSILQDQKIQTISTGTNLPKTSDNVEMKPVEEEFDEEDELEKAKLLSMKEHEDVVNKEKEKENQIKDELLENQEFIKDLLEGIDSTEIKDDDIEDVIKKLQKKEQDKNNEDK
jgi:26S proteasome regulatory subunit N10